MFWNETNPSTAAFRTPFGEENGQVLPLTTRVTSSVQNAPHIPGFTTLDYQGWQQALCDLTALRRYSFFSSSSLLLMEKLYSYTAAVMMSISKDVVDSNTIGYTQPAGGLGEFVLIFILKYSQ